MTDSTGTDTQVSVHLRKRLAIRGLKLAAIEGQTRTFSLEGRNSIQLEFQRDPSDDLLWRCTATGVWRAKGPVLNSFQALAKGQLPEGSAPLEEWSWGQERRDDGTFPPNLTLPRDKMPSSFASTRAQFEKADEASRG